jgi:DNA mismatch endonuclease (patch repair protein)
VSKFAANVARDNAVRSTLLLDNWRVATIWECAMRSKAGAESAVDVVSEWLHGTDRELDLGEAHFNHFEEHAEAVKLADR